MSKPHIVTIGVYGFSEQEFFDALQRAQVDLFCDIRDRRGVRGAAYAFANSQRLQSRLAELGIRYLHIKELAPSKQLRQTQVAVDKTQRIAKRERVELDPAFAEAYRRLYLEPFSPAEFLGTLPDYPKVIAFFCVERAPEACHRLLVAESFAEELDLEVEHIQ